MISKEYLLKKNVITMPLLELPLTIYSRDDEIKINVQRLTIMIQTNIYG